MTIDDIFNAAVSGDKALLVQLLEAGEVDINQSLDAGYSSGVHTKLPMLFSVLVKTTTKFWGSWSGTVLTWTVAYT